jgi:hypothetical protein
VTSETELTTKVHDWLIAQMTGLAQALALASGPRNKLRRSLSPPKRWVAFCAARQEQRSRSEIGRLIRTGRYH